MKKVCMVVLSATMWCSPSWSAEIEKYFIADSYRCVTSFSRSQLAVISQADDSVNIQYYYSITNGYPRFKERKWTFTREELGSQVDLIDGNFKAKLSGALTDDLVYEQLAYNGNAATDCIPQFQKAETPVTRLNNLSAILSKPHPTPDDAVAVNKLHPNLAPSQLLPAFEQGLNPKDLEKRRKEFFKRYEDQSLELASDLTNKDILPGLEGAWLAQAASKRRWHGNLLLSAQRNRAYALIAANKDDDRSSFRPVDICKRIDNVVERWNLYPYIELTTGVPIALWQQQDFDDQLSAASACENGEAFGKSLHNYWQKSEKIMAAIGRLRETRDTLLEAPLVPETLKEYAWFKRDKQLVSDSIRARISKPTIKAYYLDTLEIKRQETPDAVSKAIAARAVDNDIELRRYSNLCTDELAIAGRASELQKNTLSQCNVLMSDLFLSQSLDDIKNEKDKWLAMPSNKDTMFQAGGYGIYQIEDHQFDSIDKEINSALKLANAEVAEHLSGAFEDAKLELQQAYEDSDFHSGQRDKLDALCGQIADAERNNSVQSLLSACERYNQDFDSQVFFAKSIEEIQTEKEKWLALPATSETLYQSQDVNIEVAIPSEFGSVKEDINSAMAQANKEIVEHLFVAFEDTRKAIDLAYKAADFESGKKDKLNELCEPVYTAVKNQGVIALATLCDSYNQSFEVERASYSCTALWEELDVASELNSVELPLTDGQLLPLRELYCYYHEEGRKITVSSIQVDSSPEYSISRVEIIENTPVKFSVRLNAPPSEEHNWYLGGGKMEPDMFDAERFVSHNALLACLDSPKRCVR